METAASTPSTSNDRSIRKASPSSSSSSIHPPQDPFYPFGQFASSSGSSRPSSDRTRNFEEDEEEDVCRICRNPGDADNPLRYPCACSGSIKFVHQDCLLQWINHSKARQCEVFDSSPYASPSFLCTRVFSLFSSLCFWNFLLTVILSYLWLGFLVFLVLAMVPFVLSFMFVIGWECLNCYRVRDFAIRIWIFCWANAFCSWCFMKRFHMCDFSSIGSQIFHFSFFCFMVPRNCFCDNNPIDVIVLKLKKKLCIGNIEKVFLGLCKWALTVIIMSTHTPIHHRRMHSLNYTNAHKQWELAQKKGCLSTMQKKRG